MSYTIDEGEYNVLDFKELLTLVVFYNREERANFYSTKSYPQVIHRQEKLSTGKIKLSTGLSTELSTRLSTSYPQRYPQANEPVDKSVDKSVDYFSIDLR